MVLHDFQCEACGKTEHDVYCTDGTHLRRCTCGAPMSINWQRRHTPYIGIHAKDRAIVYYNPKTGKHATPGRSDVPMPARYAKDGYERREFETLRDLDKYCKENNLVNEKANYDSGSGRAYDDEAY